MSTELSPNRFCEVAQVKFTSIFVPVRAHSHCAAKTTLLYANVVLEVLLSTPAAAILFLIACQTGSVVNITTT
jgi:hypothetical protein